MNYNDLASDIVKLCHLQGIPICEKEEYSSKDKKTIDAMKKWKDEGSSENSEAICNPHALLKWHKEQGHTIHGGSENNPEAKGRKRSGGGKKKHKSCVKSKKITYPKNESIEDIALYIGDDPDDSLDPRVYNFEFDDGSIVSISESGITQTDISGDLIDYIEAIIDDIVN